MLVDAADARAGGHADPAVAGLTPGGAKGVSHDIVVATLVVADDSDRVVE